ncbi:MAG: transcription antitermination factor NusB [Chthonomonadales bacterium]|nr:transcription antitermination factor NusB [Chthonomonadales bacterium]
MLDLQEREHAWRVAQRAVERMATTLDRRSETSLKTAHMLSSLVRGALRFRDEIDEQVRPLVSDWPTERQSAVDRNVLRLAAFEILHREDTPVPVALNEAVELAKRYGTEESGRFVNGVLSALVARDAKHKAEEPSD